jgi:transposase-like protein
MGRVQSRGMLIAIAVNEDGYREIIGFQLANSESESSWGEFFLHSRIVGYRMFAWLRLMTIKGWLMLLKAFSRC